ncbi:MAG: ABC transporter permease [Chloroflexi bacterium]|nr:ABC transporter permease [Chloroflexota bacterium]
MIVALVTIFKAETRRQFRQNWSYRFEMIGEVALWLIAFPMMMLIFESIASSYDKPAQTASLFGFLTWDLCLGVMVVTTREITQESKQGTLETVFLSPVDPLLLFSARTGAAFTLRSVRSALLGILLARILGLHFQMTSVVLGLIGIMIGGAFGLSLLLGGIAFVHKEIGSVIGVVSLLATLATGALVPLNSLGILFLILKLVVPFTWGIDAIRFTIIGVPPGQPTVENLTWLGLILQMAILLTLGVVMFKRGYEQARKRNLLGSY